MTRPPSIRGGNYVRVVSGQTKDNALYREAGLTPLEYLTLFRLKEAPNELQRQLQYELRLQLQALSKHEGAQEKWAADMKKVLKEKGTLGGLAFLLRRYL
jgi:hypothetical protein